MTTNPLKYFTFILFESSKAFTISKTEYPLPVPKLIFFDFLFGM